MLGTDYTDVLRSVGTAHGLDAVGVAPAEPFLATRSHLEARREAGLHGGMQFTYRNPGRSTDPAATMADVAALVVGARSYRRPPPPDADPGEQPIGKVARYAQHDHYGDLRTGLDAMAGRLRADGWAAQVVLDDNALVDREAAYRAGLGWYGKNSNLLLPGRGSWFVLGSVLTNAPLTTATEPVGDGCGSCTRCLDGCPTGAIVAPGVVDARRCLAWLVQAPGAFPRQFRAALGDRIYGCDDCQEVCPPNRRLERDDAGGHDAAGEHDEPGETDSAGEPGVALLDLLASTDEALLARHGRWYIPRREPRYLRRNALVAVGNSEQGDQLAVVQTLIRYLGHPDPMLRAHAAWAARKLGRTDLLAMVADDPAPEVREELAAGP